MGPDLILFFLFFFFGFSIKTQLNKPGAPSRESQRMEKIQEGKSIVMEEWVQQAQTGDTKAQEQIIEKICPLLYKMMLYVPKEYREVEDLYQESVLQVLEWIQGYERERGVPFIGYIQSMLRYWYLSKRKELKEYPMDWNDMENYLGMVEGEEEIRLLAQERNQSLKKALEALTPPQRKAVWKFYVQRVSLGKIAKELGCSYPMAVKHKQKGLENLRKNLSKDLI